MEYLQIIYWPFRKDYNGSIYLEDVEKLKMDGFDLVTTVLAIAIPIALFVWFIIGFEMSVNPWGNTGK